MSLTSTYPTTHLRGRYRELAVLDELLNKARAGTSGVLVLCGEPGIGKTALLDYLVSRARGFRVDRFCAVQSEMELPFAGLHLLFGSMADRLERLPGPQREALEVALGVRDGRASDRLLVGLAVLNLLADLAEEQPLACLVDDVQWLDQSSLQALAFAARRLVADRVVVVFCVRAGSDVSELAGLPELTLARLHDPDARALLASAVHGRLDPSVADRIVGETHGNPLAILQFSRRLSPADLGGGFIVPGTAGPLPGRIEDGFRQQVQSLPPATRQLLLAAAAERTGSGTLLWRAATSLGIGTDAAAPAEALELIDFGAQVRFRHPLVRSATYQSATPDERRTVHRAIAEVLDTRADADRRAWHRAQAATGPDEEVAAELERSAGRAQARGGLAAAAEFLRLATELTPDPALRSVRALAAAQAKFSAGSADAAYELLATAAAGPLDALQQARLERLRARLAFSWTRGSDAPALFLDAARRLAPLDPRQARETYLEAIEAAIFAGRLGRSGGLAEVAAAAANAPPAARPASAIDILLDGLTARLTGGYSAGLAPLRSAVQALTRLPARPAEDDMYWYLLWVECSLTPEPIAPEVWDDRAWDELATRAVEVARDAGAVTALPVALSSKACSDLHAGNFTDAATLKDEGQAISEAMGSAVITYTDLVLAAWRGEEGPALDLIEAGLKDAIVRGEGRCVGVAEYSTALLYNGLGRYETALAAAQRACRYDDLCFFNWSLIEVIEAAARSGDQQAGAQALGTLAERTQAAGTDWALGVEAFCRALLSDGEIADSLYRQSIERLARTRVVIHLARAYLLHGEWLRRENRRQEARDAFHRADEIFSRAGILGFGGRAQRELLATGETVRKRTVDKLADLTAQEAQVVDLAKEGLTNPEIAAQMFISPRTVEWHLGNVFGKLGITSRKDLRGLGPRGPSPGIPPGRRITPRARVEPQELRARECRGGSPS
ncbi:MAG TPA: AAA family ATPase [Streptosporangiaceae bacterium]|nr:AAA family ATPase [Streptosporangiaceae bacterium]